MRRGRLGRRFSFYNCVGGGFLHYGGPLGLVGSHRSLSCDNKPSQDWWGPPSRAPEMELLSRADEVDLRRALVGNRPSLPKKDNLVVYFPQGHFEYAALVTSSSFSSSEVPTVNLQPEITCRVQHVQSIANNMSDEAYAHVTLLPEQKLGGQNRKSEEVTKSGVNEAKDRRRPTKAALCMFSVTLSKPEDLQTILMPVDAYEVFPLLDFKRSSQVVYAEDVQGTQWKFYIEYEDSQRRYQIRRGWTEFVRRKRLSLKDTVAFVRCGDWKLRLGVKRFGCECGVPVFILANYYQWSRVLSRLDDATIVNSLISPHYHLRLVRTDFIIHYQKYMESTFEIMGAPAPQTASAKALSSYELQRNSRPRAQKKLNDLDTDGDSFLASLRTRKSDTVVMPTHLKISKLPDQEIPLDPMVHNSLKHLEFDSCLFHSPILLRYFPTTLETLKMTNCIGSEHVLDLLMNQKDSSLEFLEVDSCSSLVSLPIHKLPTTIRQIKISNCTNLKSLGESLDNRKHDSVGSDPAAYSDLSVTTLTVISQLRELAISDCEELEFLPEGLHNLIHLELLAISNCPSLVTFPEGGLPKNSLTSFLIHECENLKSFPCQLHKVTSLKNLDVRNCHCLVSFPEGGLPPNLVSLRVVDCQNLHPPSQWGLHKLKHLRNYTFIDGRRNHANGKGE